MYVPRGLISTIFFFFKFLNICALKQTKLLEMVIITAVTFQASLLNFSAMLCEVLCSYNKTQTLQLLVLLLKEELK